MVTRLLPYDTYGETTGWVARYCIDAVSSCMYVEEEERPMGGNRFLEKGY